MDITKSTIANLFSEMGFNYLEMEYLKPYDVSNLGYKIKTPYGLEKITKIIRKNDAFVYQMNTSDFELIASGNHLVYVRNDKYYDDYMINEWKMLCELVQFSENYKVVLTKNGFQEFSVKSLDRKMPILDIEVEQSHSYYSNGIASHNTIFGNPETTTGGMALRFWASVRLDIRRSQAIKDKDEVIGNRTKVTVKKNKVSSPFKVAEFDIMYNEGISRIGDILDLSVEHELIEKRGAFYSYGEQRLAQGKENAKQFLKENPEILLTCENALRTKLRLPIRLED